MDNHCPMSGPLLDGIELKHGPANLLRRFFSRADQETKGRGVSLSFASLDDLVEVNKSNSETWRPLFPIFNPNLSGITSETGFALLGRDSSGEVVVTQAARFYDWDDACLFDEVTSLRMFYADTKAAFERGDRCEIATPIAHGISGHVVFSGGGWYRRDYRGKGFSVILPRISRAYAFTRWNSDFTISIMADAVVAGGMAQRCGYTNIELGTVDFVGSPLGAVRGALVWMGSKQLLSDLDAFFDDHRDRSNQTGSAI
ncbi:hypothetical protein SAMN05519103_03310 [Rhizobiales bacterium GAS113]|nr:hypothetical protein SAMN05519103_03310 [Rhizobiales bacterium GAS113]